jgi:hypothetical protein
VLYRLTCRLTLFLRAALRGPFDRRRWARARSLAELGELTALWLEERIVAHPGYGDLHNETYPLIVQLARLNRAGFVTTSSQPGSREHIGYGPAYWAQRPAIEGIADAVTASRLCAAATAAGLHVTTAPATADFPQVAGKALAVTVRNGKPYTVFGPASWPGVRELFPGCYDPALLRELRAAWQVTIADLRFEPADLLWRTLDAALSGARPFASRLG